MAARDTAIRASRSKRREAPSRALRCAPRAAIAAGREDGVLRIHTAFPQLAEARARPVPLLPNDGAEAPPNPLVKTSENRGRLAEAEVRPPSEQIRGQLPHHLAKAHAPYPSCQHPDSLPEPNHRRGGQPPLRPGAARKAKAQKRPYPSRRHRALRRVDLELEPRGDEARKACHHAMSRTSTVDIHVTVVRIAHETVTAAFQLAVQGVEHNVRQQG